MNIFELRRVLSPLFHFIVDLPEVGFFTPIIFDGNGSATIDNGSQLARVQSEFITLPAFAVPAALFVDIIKQADECDFNLTERALLWASRGISGSISLSDVTKLRISPIPEGTKELVKLPNAVSAALDWIGNVGSSSSEKLGVHICNYDNSLALLAVDLRMLHVVIFTDLPQTNEVITIPSVVYKALADFHQVIKLGYTDRAIVAQSEDGKLLVVAARLPSPLTDEVFGSLKQMDIGIMEQVPINANVVNFSQRAASMMSLIHNPSANYRIRIGLTDGTIRELDLTCETNAATLKGIVELESTLDWPKAISLVAADFKREITSGWAQSFGVSFSGDRTLLQLAGTGEGYLTAAVLAVEAV